MSDLIDRQTANDAMAELQGRASTKAELKGISKAWKRIKKLPPVTPKQRTGYWYPVGVAEVVGGESAQWGSAIAYHKCSECDEQALRDDFEQEILSKFCPHCGLKMEKWSDD